MLNFSKLSCFILFFVFLNSKAFAYPPLGKEEFKEIVNFSNELAKDCSKDCMIIGIGRSPTPFIAYLQSHEGEGYPKALTIPLSSLSGGITPGIETVLDEAKKQRLFNHFEKFLEPQRNLEGIKKILVFDYSYSGKSVLLAAHYLDDYINNYLNKDIVVELKTIAAASEAKSVANFFIEAKKLPQLGPIFARVINDPERQIMTIPDGTELEKSLLKKQYGPASEYGSFELSSIDEESIKKTSPEYLNLRDLISRFHQLESSSPERLVTLLNDPNPEVQLAVLLLIGHLKNPDMQVFQQLISLLDSKNVNLKSLAIRVLGSFNPTDPSVLIALVKKLKDFDKEIYGISPQVRFRSISDVAVQELGKIKPKAPVVIENLLELLEDKTELMAAIRAAEVLGVIDAQDPRVVDALIEKLSDNKLISLAAFKALIQIKLKTPEQIFKLQSLLESPVANTRKRATTVLWKSVPLNSTTLKKMVYLLQHEKKEIQSEMALILGLILGDELQSPLDPEILRSIIELLNSNNINTRTSAAEVLKKSFLAFSEISDEAVRNKLKKYLILNQNEPIDIALGRETFDQILSYFKKA